MNDKPRVHPRLHFLLNAACEERLTAAQVAELELLMRGDPEAQRLYHEYCQLHVDLHFVASGERIRKTVCSRFKPASPPVTLSSFWPQIHTCLTFSLGVSILVLGVWIWGRPTSDLSVACLADTFHARWAGRPAPNVGQGLTIGQRLLLKSGLAVVRFRNGTEVLLHGPAAFTLQSASAGRLTRGRLVVRVETPEARGFVIHSPTARIIDEGTEFGVAVTERGRTEAYVFAGKIDMCPAIGEKPLGEGQCLTAGKAAEIAPETRQLVISQPRPYIFVRAIPDTAAVYSRAVLAIRPDCLWAYCRLEEKSVSPTGDPTYAENAVASGNRYVAMWGNLDRRRAPACGAAGPGVEDAFVGFSESNRAAEFLGPNADGGMPVLQFGSVPHHAPNAADRQFDVPSQTIAFFLKTSQNTPDARIFVAHSANEHDFQIVMSRGRLGITTRDDSADQTVMTADRYDDDRWHHVVVIRNGEEAANARLYVDGEPAPMKGVPQGFQAGVTSCFGAQDRDSAGWQGALDEIAVWNTPLDETEVVALYQAALGVAQPVVHSENP